MLPCPTDHELNRYHAGDLDQARAEEIRAHLAACAACTERDSSIISEHEELVKHVRELGASEGLADLLKSSGSRAASKKPTVQKIKVQAAPPVLDDALDVGAKSPPQGLIEGYEILREIHRGGQGVVFQAVQKSTKRKVAVKVLLEGPYASAAAKRRFEREVELIANLKHPNIVTVFDSGITADGRHYCVMDYVRGERLDQYVRDSGLGLEDALRLFMTICQAVNYAHQKGIIHRDLKPTNILVDNEGNPKILDFGLAKQMAGGPETLLSVTGEVMGTLPYLSPEAARGHPDEVDTRTDVYALGVILYEMLTGQYPYPVAGEIMEVLKNITDTAPAPPSKAWRPGSGLFRRAESGVPSGRGCPVDAEVETIVLKALSKERERRYQSALELARDIGHYLAGEPIEAKRDSSWYVLKKTLGRHRAAVAVAALIAFLVVGSSITLSIMYSAAVDSRREAEAQAERANKQMERALSAEAKAKEQLERALVAEGRAKRRFDQVRELANTFMFEIHAAISDLPGSTPARELLVKTALTYLDSLAEEAADDPELQRELAIAYGKVGDVQGSIRKASLGDTSAAMKSYEKSLQIFEKLATADPQDDRVQVDLAYAVTQVADMYWVTSRIEEALSGYRRSKDIAEAAGIAHPENSRAKRVVVQGLEDEADTLLSMGKSQEALSLYREARRHVEEMVAADPSTPEHRSDLALLLDRIGGMVLRTGNTDEALANVREALRLREALTAENPESTLYREWTATSYTHLGDAYDWISQPADAMVNYRKSLEIWDALAAADPKNTRGQRELAVACDRVAAVEYAQQQTEAALGRMRRSLEIRERLVASNPANATWRGDLASSLGQIARVQAETGELTAAVENDRRAVDIWEALTKADPASAEMRAALAVSYRDLAGHLRQADKNDEAVKFYCQAIEMRTALVEAEPENVESRLNLAGEYDRLGDLQMADGKLEDSAICFQKALSLAAALAEKEPDRPARQRNLAVAHYKVGICDVRLAGEEGRSKEQRIELLEKARRELRESRDMFQRLIEQKLLAKGEASVVQELDQELDKCDTMMGDIKAGRPTTARADQDEAAGEQDGSPGTRTEEDDD